MDSNHREPPPVWTDFHITTVNRKLTNIYTTYKQKLSPRDSLFYARRLRQCDASAGASNDLARRSNNKPNKSNTINNKDRQYKSIEHVLLIVGQRLHCGCRVRPRISHLTSVAFQISRVCVCVCVCAGVRACGRSCVRACVREWY